jgi:hypothetical protein
MTGALPGEGTVCPTIMPPFPSSPEEANEVKDGGGVVVDDTHETEMAFGTSGEMRDAVLELSRVWKPFNQPIWGGGRRFLL